MSLDRIYMKHIKIEETFFVGAASIERTEAGLKPWRLPHYNRHLYPSPGDKLMDAASHSSGVRLRFSTNSRRIGLTFQPLPAISSATTDGHWFDLVIDNQIVEAKSGFEGTEEISFENIPEGDHVIEIWLPPSCSVTLSAFQIEQEASIQPVSDRRPMWIIWGSSLTHCVRAGSAALTWPAIVARKHNLNLLNLGFKGQCHLDPMVAMFIRDQNADFITLKLGINTISGSLNARTFPALVTSAVKIIREKNHLTPISLISPIAYPRHETTPNVVGYTMANMRDAIKTVHESLVQEGDLNLYYTNGLKLFDVGDIHNHSDDQCHPKSEGIKLQAERFIKNISPILFGE